MMNQKKHVAGMALILAAMVVTTGVGVYGLQEIHTDDTWAAEDTAKASVQENSAEQEILTEVLNQQNVSHSSQTGKEENVYVIADANGQADQIIVSNWLKNATGADSMEDVTTLREIENVKGDGTYTRGKGNEIIWEANGSDVYYQGTTDQELPVEIVLTYYLDGKEIKPEELAGKSGHVTIRFNYINHETRTVMIAGEDTQMYVPFAVLSGVMLPIDRFSNVSVTNGKIISEGNHNIVVGLAFPGLKESLNLEELRMKNAEDQDEYHEIPDYVEISADVTDFQLEMTLSMILPDSLSSVELTDDIDFSGVSDQLRELNESMTLLSESSTSLVAGSRELAEGTDELVGGLTTLTQGSGSVLQGVQQLSQSLNGMAGQLQSAHEKYFAATQAMEQLKESGLSEEYAYCAVILSMDPKALGAMDRMTVCGYADCAKQIYTMLGQMDMMYQALISGNESMKLLSDGSLQLYEGMQQALEGAVSLQEGAHALYEGMDTFDSEGIRVLTEKVSGMDVESAVEFADRLSAVFNQADTYSTYSGAPENLDSTVKFIVRTGAVKE